MKGASICCENSADLANCAHIANGTDSEKSSWVCTGSVLNSVYALSHCPFKMSSCGPFSEYEFFQSGDSAAVQFKNLEQGEVCAYNVKAQCGAPSFQILGGGVYKSLYVEWQEDKVERKPPINSKPYDSKELK